MLVYNFVEVELQYDYTIFLGVFVVDSGDCSGDLHISACRTAERSERMSFVSLARSASVHPPTGVALVTTALSQRSGSGSGTSEVVIEERRRR